MKKVIMHTALLLFLLVSASSLKAQDSTKSAQFAMVYLPAIYSDIYDESVVFYDNGTKENLLKLLNLLPLKRGRADQNISIIRGYEFKMLKYMYSKGFELLSVNYEKTTYYKQFYFKRTEKK